MDWFVENSPAEIRICATDEHGVIQHMAVERLHDVSLVGGVYAGRVRASDDAMGGVFIDIGLPKINGQDNWAFCPNGKGLKIGDAVVVQVTRDGFGGKSVGVSRHIAYHGRYFTIRHSIKGVQFDRKLGQGKRRAETEKSLGKALQGRNNMVVHAPAHGIAPDVFAQRLDTAFNTWQSWRDYSGDVPACLHSAPRLVERMLCDADTEDRIMFATARDAKPWEKSLSAIAPDLGDGVVIPDPADIRGGLFYAMGLDDSIADLLNRHVPLDGGGSIVIEPTEAMTVIDVNSTGATNLAKGDEALNHINKKACKAIANRILALNISGLIVVDFITIKNKGVTKRLMDTMRAECRKRGVDVDVLGITVGGLMEITRKRTAPSLWEIVYHRPTLSPTPVTIGAELLRTMVAQKGVGKPEIIAPKPVLNALQNQLAHAYADVNRIMGQEVILTTGDTPTAHIRKA